VTPHQAEADAAATLGEIPRLAKYQGFLFRWYDTRTGAAIASPHGQDVIDGYVSANLYGSSRTVEEGKEPA
jgi:hypothetical protein